MTTELAHYEPGGLAEEMEYAKAVASAAMLPDTYRGKPADIMVAVGLGRAMGLSPAESLYRISVIKGKPSASAELIAANVRKAGHRLRVKVTENPPSATCTIIRADDPDEPTVITRDMAWAERMGLDKEPNYRKQPSTMLSWRAITACARLACPEALYGVVYSPDELTEAPRAATVTVVQEDRLGALLDEQPVVQSEELVEAELVPESPLLDTSSRLAKRLYATIGAAGIPELERIPFIASAIGRPIGSSKEITEAEVHEVLDNFDALLADFMGAGS